MSVKLLTEHHLKFLSLKGGCTGLSESILVKMSNFWKSHAAAQFYLCMSSVLPCSIVAGLCLSGHNKTKGKWR